MGNSTPVMLQAGAEAEGWGQRKQRSRKNCSEDESVLEVCCTRVPGLNNTVLLTSKCVESLFQVKCSYHKEKGHNDTLGGVG